MLTGSFPPSRSALISDIWISRVTECAAMMKQVTSLSIVTAKIVGINMSTKSTITVFDASTASGTLSSSRYAVKGEAGISNSVVYSVITSAVLPSPMIARF